MRLAIVPVVLAATMFASAPAGAAQDGEIYRKSIECGALHGFYAGFVEDDDPEAATANEDLSTRYIVMAINRSGGDFDAVDAAVVEEAERLAAVVEDETVTEADFDAFFGERNAYCEAFNAQVREEFESLDLDE